MKEETICQKRMHGYSFITPRSVLDSDVTCNHTWHCSLWRNLFIRIPRRNHVSFQYCINLSRSKFKVYLFGGFTPTLCLSEKSRKHQYYHAFKGSPWRRHGKYGQKSSIQVPKGQCKDIPKSESSWTNCSSNTLLCFLLWIMRKILMMQFDLISLR